MADQGVKLSEIIESVSLSTDADYLVGTRKNNDGTFTDFRYKASLLNALLAAAIKPLVIYLTADTVSITHPNLIGATKVFVYSVGGSRLRDNSIEVWDNDAQAPISIPDDAAGIDGFDSSTGVITLNSTHVAGEIFIVDYI